ncbi:hypothetical protein LguiA_031938 [Lonicera macranthoides]
MSTNKKLTIFMLPWLAHGHISPFLELAKKLSQKNIFIYFCSTPINLTSINNQITHLKNIQVIELNLPSSPNLPPHLHTTNGLPTHLVPNLRAAIDSARPDFARILKGLEPDLLIHDIALQWAADIASSLNIPNVQFLTSSAAFASFFLHIMACPGVDYPFPGIYLREFEFSAMLKLLQIPAGGGDGAAGKEEENKLREIPQGSSTILLIKSLKEIEGKYMDYFSLLNKKKVVSVGPLNRDSSHDDESSDIIEWLDEKNPCSTVFVSFGSEYFLSKDEITEIAYGLELSGVNFLWVLRFPKGEEISSVVEEAIFPEDFLEKVRERGRIVKGWAPQAQILGHPSVGGFVSHCGWNSVMESINCGVPVIAMPMQLDQPLNARLMVDIGVGVEIARGDNGKIERDEVAKVVREVAGGEIGEDLRKKTRELAQKMKLNGEEEIDGAIEELLQLCAKE